MYVKYLKSMDINHPKFEDWYTDTELSLKYIFGEDSTQLSKFYEIEFEPGLASTIVLAMGNRYDEKRFFRNRLDEVKALLKFFEKEINMLWPEDNNGKSSDHPLDFPKNKRTNVYRPDNKNEFIDSKISMNKYYFKIIREFKKYQDKDGNYKLVPMNNIVEDMINKGSATIEMKGNIKQSISSMYSQYSILDFGGHGDYRLNSKGHNLYYEWKEKNGPTKNTKLKKQNKKPTKSIFRRKINIFFFWLTVGTLGTVLGGLLLALIFWIIS